MSIIKSLYQNHKQEFINRISCIDKNRIGIALRNQVENHFLMTQLFEDRNTIESFRAGHEIIKEHLYHLEYYIHYIEFRKLSRYSKSIPEITNEYIYILLCKSFVVSYNRHRNDHNDMNDSNNIEFYCKEFHKFLTEVLENALITE